MYMIGEEIIIIDFSKKIRSNSELTFRFFSDYYGDLLMD